MSVSSCITDCIKCGEQFNYSQYNNCPNCGASLPKEDTDDEEYDILDVDYNEED